MRVPSVGSFLWAGGEWAWHRIFRILPRPWGKHVIIERSDAFGISLQRFTATARSAGLGVTLRLAAVGNSLAPARSEWRRRLLQLHHPQSRAWGSLWVQFVPRYIVRIPGATPQGALPGFFLLADAVQVVREAGALILSRVNPQQLLARSFPG